MNFDCIVTQVHIPEYDVQGSLTGEQKLKLVEIALEHLRHFNKESYIILTGHGYKPKNHNICDHVYWEDNHLPLNEHGYVIGMPAQFKFVSIGIEHAISKGFNRVLKTRGDCVIGHRNITSYCNDVLNREGSSLLITQQTGPDRMGDCFMYGDINVLHKTWHHSNRVWSPDGLQNTALNYRMAIGSNDDWLKLIRSNCSFRDVDELLFACLRWNFHNLNSIDDTIVKQLMDGVFDFGNFHWGKSNGWHRFDKNRNMTGSADWMYSRKTFYETTDFRR